MKFQLEKILLVIVLLFCFVSTSYHIILPHQGAASSNQAIKNIAIILDSPEFYDSSFIDDVLNGFDLVNQTYNMNYTVFPLTNYSRQPITYYYNNTQTNHTELADELAQKDQYDLVVMMGYEHRSLRTNPACLRILRCCETADGVMPNISDISFAPRGPLCFRSSMILMRDSTPKILNSSAFLLSMTVI